MRFDSPVHRRWEVPTGIVLLVAGQASFAAQEFTTAGLALWLAGIVAIVWRYRDEQWGAPTMAPSNVVDSTAWASARTVVPAAASLVAAIVLWLEQRRRPLDEARIDLVALWFASMALAVIAVWQPRRVGPQDLRAALQGWWDRCRIDVLVVLGLVLAAGGPRLIALQSYPRSFNGDEAAFAVLSRRLLDGEIRNPFGVGYLSHPLMWNVVQASSMDVFGVDVAGARAPNAFVGAAAVGLTYLLVLRLTGRRATALAAGVLLGSFQVHIYWSRSALPNGWTAMTALLVLYLLDRSLASRRGVGLLVTGVVVGLAQYFYFGSRILLPVVLGVLVIVAIDDRRRIGRLGPAVRSTLARIVLVVTGFTLAVLPQLAYYSLKPYDFDSRSRSVSIFSAGWLARESERTGDHPVLILVRQFVDAALMPFRTVVIGQFRGDPPYVGWALALLSAVGLGLVTIRVARGGAWTGLALLYWFSAAGVATTIEPTTASRFVTTATLICVLAALGLEVAVRYALSVWPALSRTIAVVAAVVVIGTAAVNLYSYFRDDDQVEVYGDANTELVDHLARSLQRSDHPDTVYLAGAPRVWYDGFFNFMFRAPDVVGLDLERPLTTTDEVPTLRGSTLFVFIPEREAELEVVRLRYPDGESAVVSDDAGGTLYTTYAVSP